MNLYIAFSPGLCTILFLLQCINVELLPSVHIVNRTANSISLSWKTDQLNISAYIIDLEGYNENISSWDHILSQRIRSSHKYVYNVKFTKLPYYSRIRVLSCEEWDISTSSRLCTGNNLPQSRLCFVKYREVSNYFNLSHNPQSNIVTIIKTADIDVNQFCDGDPIDQYLRTSINVMCDMNDESSRGEGRSCVLKSLENEGQYRITVKLKSNKNKDEMIFIKYLCFSQPRVNVNTMIAQYSSYYETIAVRWRISPPCDNVPLVYVVVVRDDKVNGSRLCSTVRPSDHLSAPPDHRLFGREEEIEERVKNLYENEACGEKNASHVEKDDVDSTVRHYLYWRDEEQPINATVFIYSVTENGITAPSIVQIKNESLRIILYIVIIMNLLCGTYLSITIYFHYSINLD